MDLQWEDFNGSDALATGAHSAHWNDVEDVLRRMTLHLKASDQAGIQGRPIFDPVGTNAAIKKGLRGKDWDHNIPIPKEFSFLGTDVDFGKEGVIAEAQFSNYPFLLNNTVRSELFSKAGIRITGHALSLVVIITKAHMFPASNSTLYYEQAVDQLTSLAKHNVFDVPIRLVGLFVDRAGTVPVTWTDYGARYSRTVDTRAQMVCEVSPGATSRSRCRLEIQQ